MPFNTSISRTDAAALIPEEVSAQIIQAVPETSNVMRLARRLPNMSRNQLRLPVASALATAYFVDGDTGLKQTTEVNWENKYIDAAELACIIPISSNVVDDAEFDIWAEARPKIVEAMAKAIDAAVLHGTNIPSSWTTNIGAAGLLAGATTASQTQSLAGAADAYEAIMGNDAAVTGVIGFVEEDGYFVNGHIAHLSLRRTLRGTRDSDGGLIFMQSMQGGAMYELDGQTIFFDRLSAVSSATALLFSGDWSQLVYSIRQDITFKVFDTGVITDNSGTVVFNLMQQDMVALRAVMRIGFALPNPINRVQETAASRFPFGVLVP